MSSFAPKSIAVIGGGLTGLTAAYRLNRLGHRVTVFEQSPRIGGSIVSTVKEGFLIEGGPNALQLGEPELVTLLTELGIDAEKQIAAPAAKKRFIVRQGRLMATPSSPPSALGTPLFSLRTKLGIFWEMTYRRRERATDISLAEFVRSHFGQEAVDYALNPFVSGVYAGDPEKLSTRHSFPTLWQIERTHGSILRGMMALAKERRARGQGGVPPLVSFPRGLQTLPDTLAARLPAGTVRTNTHVTNVIPGRPWKLITVGAGTTSTAEFDQLVLAVPAASLAALVFGTLGERPLAALEHLPHPPVSSLFLGFKREQVSHPLDGFGGLVPAIEHRKILGVLFSSTLFPGRAPAGHVGLTVFAGGMRQPEIARLPTDALVAEVAPDLRDLVGAKGEPVFVQHSFWPHAIPQYNLGHERFLDAMADCESRHPGLFIGGNCRDGIALPNCVKSGLNLARRADETAA
ncbi:MAG: protoporphyrinogen oxidase [Opitutaceae bacterium]|nr:protoporphyrinogen oxidase [Opitutaceae bacterium]